MKTGDRQIEVATQGDAGHKILAWVSFFVPIVGLDLGLYMLTKPTKWERAKGIDYLIAAAAGTLVDLFAVAVYLFIATYKFTGKGIL